MQYSVRYLLIIASIYCLILAGSTELAESGRQGYPDAARQSRDDNCCGDLGCFDIAGEFLDILKRPINPFPSCDTKVKISLKTQDNVAKPDLLDPSNPSTINSSHFRADREGTKILIHGYLDNENVRWMALMEPKLLLQGDFNVIRVSWDSGIDVTYFQAAANTRVVGAIIARLLHTLQTKFGLDLSKVHVIGHSLGAHIAGYVGKRIKIGRITGLDPAGLYFKDMPPTVRLVSTDADLVETVVTDGRDLMQLGYGSLQPMGHINYYPNGGKDQPGCGKSLWSSLISFDISGAANDALGCSHFRAPILYADTVANPSCTFLAVQCDSYEAFKSGKCFSCDDEKCSRFGLDSDDNQQDLAGQEQRSYFFLTGDTTPFCVLMYRITITLSMQMTNTEQGTAKIQLHAASKSSDWIDMTPQAVVFQPGATYTCVISVPQNFGQIESVHLTWAFDYSLLHPLAWLTTHSLRPQSTLELMLLQNEPVLLTTPDTLLNEKQIIVFKRNGN